MKTVKFNGCKHLVYDTSKYDNRLSLKELPMELGVYWERPDCLCNGINKEVQFCALRGRLNSRIACLEGAGFECSLGEMVEHTVNIEAAP